MNYEFKSGFAKHMSDMLEYRTAMGRSTVGYRWNLANLDRFCMELFPDEAILTKEIAVGWCGGASGSSNYRAQTIRGFGKYLVSVGEAAFVLPRSFSHKKRRGCHIFFLTVNYRGFLMPRTGCQAIPGTHF